MDVFQEFSGHNGWLGLLSKADEKYEITQAAKDFLLSDSPYYQGDWILNTAAETTGAIWRNH
jgi:hypothetical protein